MSISIKMVRSLSVILVVTFDICMAYKPSDRMLRKLVIKPDGTLERVEQLAGHKLQRAEDSSSTFIFDPESNHNKNRNENDNYMESIL